MSPSGTPIDRSTDSPAAARPRPAAQYKAFISYSHAAQGALAPVLQSALQRFAKPFYRLRAIRVFRDETSLALTPKLWPTIQKALGGSEYFILMASPAAAASEWVQAEVNEWLRLHDGSTEKLLIVLAAGELAWNKPAADFDWEQTTALPANLRGSFDAEPFFLDFRWASDRSQLSPRNPQFLRGIAKLASTLRDMPLDAMIGEDVRQHRITRIVMAVVAVLLVALGVATSIAAYVAQQQRDAAVRQARIALAGQLAAQAQVAYGQHGDLLERGVLLAVESARLIPDGSFDTNMALRDGIDLLPTSRIQVPVDDNVFDLAVSPDGAHAAVASGSTVEIFAVASGRIVRRLTHAQTVFSVAFTPDGARLVTTDGDVRLWRAGDGTADGALDTAGFVSRLAVSPNGQRLATVAGNTATIWDLSSRRPLCTVTHDNDVGANFSQSINRLAFSPDSASFATAADDHTVRVWNASTGEALARADYEEGVHDIAYSHDGRLLATAGDDLTARLLDAATGEELAKLSHAGPVTAVAFSPDDAYLATAGSEKSGGRNVGNRTEFFDYKDLAAHVWSTVDGREVARFPHRDEVWALAWSPDGGRLATASFDRTARVWDVAGGFEVTRMVHDGRVTRVAFTADGEHVLTGTENGEGGKKSFASIWSAADPRFAGMLRHPPGETVHAVAFDPTGRYVATATSSIAVRVFDRRSGAEAHSIFHPGGTSAVAFSPDGNYLALGLTAPIDSGPGGPVVRAGATVLVVQRTPEGIIPPFEDWAGFAHGTSVDQVAFTPDGRHLVTRGDDRSVRIWNVAERRQAAQLVHDAAVTAFALSPDGSTVATAAGNETLLWATTATAEPRARMKQSSAVVGVAFRPDGQALATLANDGTERLSDLSGRVLWESRHPGNPSAIAFDPSGAYVAMASDDAVTLCDAGTGKEGAPLRHDATITGMATSRDGAFVATTANDETTRIWSAADGHEVIRFATARLSTLLGFDPSGEHLLVASEGGVANLLWRTRDLVAVACAHLRRGLTADERRHFLLASTAAQSCPSEP